MVLHVLLLYIPMIFLEGFDVAGCLARGLDAFCGGDGGGCGGYVGYLVFYRCFADV